MSNATKIKIINGTKINYRGNEYGVIPEVYFEDPYRVREIKQGGIVIDIGACIGAFCLRCAKERNCTVYAYEPYEESYKLIIENIKINDLQDKVKVFNKAVTNKIDTRDFYIHPNHYAGCTFYPGRGIPYIPVKVDCTTLRQIFIDNDLHKCDVLKMDCEGEEKYILNSTDIDTLRKIDKIILEYHHYTDGKEISEYLKKMGFSVYPKDVPKVSRSILYAINRCNES